MVVDYTTLRPYVDHDRILSNDTPGKLSRINGDSREETFFDFAPLFLPGHWNEDIVPAAGDHLVTTGSRHEDKRPACGYPGRKRD